MKTKRTEISDALQEYLVENVLAKGVRFTADTAFEDIGIDSVTVIELIIHVDDQFGIDIPVEELSPENLRSIHTIADCALKFAVKNNSRS